MIVPGAAGAFGVFFLRQFFLSLPMELEEAALIDGANRLQIFLRIILPLSKAPLATLAVLSFLTNWNDFLWPVYVLLSPESLTLQPGPGDTARCIQHELHGHHGRRRDGQHTGPHPLRRSRRGTSSRASPAAA